MRLATLRQKNVDRCKESFHPVADWTPTDWACAVAGEVGEMCNLIKKRRRGEDIDDRAIADEMADAVIYLDLLAERLGIDLEHAIARKFDAVSQRVGSGQHFSTCSGRLEECGATTWEQYTTGSCRQCDRRLM